MTKPIDTARAKPLARYAAWKRKGDFVFFSGVIPVDPDTRRVVAGFADLPAEARAALGESGEMSVDAFEGPILAQSWTVLAKIRGTIEDAGGTMADVFKLVQYFRDLRHYPYYNRVRKLFFPADPPVSTVVEVAGLLPSREVLIEVEATAYMPKP